MAISNEIDTLASQYDSDGFCLVRNVFSGSLLTELQNDFERIVDRLISSGEDVNARWTGVEADRVGGSNTVVLHTHNVQQYSAAWLRALVDKNFIQATKSLIGEDIILHHTKLFQKPSELGAPFPMHQDWGYFPTLKDTMLAAVIHVSDATDEMGCLRVYPGSHKLGRLNEAMGGEHLKEYPLESATPVEARAGDVLFFNYLTIHGSMPNRSSETRKTVLVQMHSGQDEVEAGNEHPNEHLVLSGWNYGMKRSMANTNK